MAGVDVGFCVNGDLCVRCGLCVRDCPARIIEREGGAVPFIRPEQGEQCLRCQHCLAVCPTGAISILGRKAADSLLLAPGSIPRFDQMAALVRGRRSVRQYRDENVPPALLRRLLTTLANAPTGVNRRELTFIVVDDRDVMQRLRERSLKALAALAEAGRLPSRFAYLEQAIPAYFERKVDMIFRGAPHALVVAAPADAPCPEQDVALALAFFDLLAQSAGLGTVWCGMMKMVLEAVPELKPTFGLTAGHVYYPMLFGVPAVRYARTVQRDDGAAIRTVLG